MTANTQSQTAESLHLVRARILSGEVPSDAEMAELLRRIVKRWPFECDMDELFTTGKVTPPKL